MSALSQSFDEVTTFFARNFVQAWVVACSLRVVTKLYYIAKLRALVSAVVFEGARS